MNRNAESGFAFNPTVSIGRSRFARDSSVKLTFDVGQLIPFYVDEVLPGDTFNITTSKVVRLQTLLTPMMDNIYLDFYWFFVPNRLTWTHWREFNGENTSGYWYPQVSYTVPQIKFDWNLDCQPKSVADYMGIPVGQIGQSGDEFSVNALPFRAYGLVYNEFFRDENLIAPDNVYLGDSTEQVDVGTSSYKGDPYIVSKYHDYFTSCLPAPQKGPDVELPLNGIATVEDVLTGKDHPNNIFAADAETHVHFTDLNGDPPGIAYNAAVNAQGYLFGHTNNVPSSGNKSLFPSNLQVELNPDDFAFGVNINQLRLAFQIQKLYEKDARGGSRYIELIRSHFGVTSPDYRLQRPEYLGGNRVPLNVNQVVQQSATVSTSPMGNTAGFSMTSDVHGDFTKSFTEHGFVIGLCVARYDHTYQQGVERFWNRQTRFDYYWPVLANIGEQAVRSKEIYVDGTAGDDDVFGYQEAWADYRYKPNRVCAEMRSSYSTSLDMWHLADDYSSRPALSQAWIQEDKSPVDRVLAINSSVSNQIFADIFVKNVTTRPMPLYSIPGLIDHH